MIKYYDKENRFVEIFNPQTGFYLRSGILDKNGKDTGVDPFMRNFPQLIDVGIMERCVCAHKCKVDCYQKAVCRTGENMSLENYKKILEQGKGKLFQCLHENEVVLRKTPFGTYESVYIKDVNIDDELYCPDGISHTVYEINKKKALAYKISLSYGKEIIATGEHKFPTPNGLKMVSELQKGDILLRNHIHNKSNIDKIDLVKLIANSPYSKNFYLFNCDDLNELAKKYNLVISQTRSISIDRIAPYLNEIDYSNALIRIGSSQYYVNAIWKITEDLMILLGHYVGNGSHRSIVVNKSQSKMIEKIKVALSKCFYGISYNEYINNNTYVLELKSSLLFERIFDNILNCRIMSEKQLPSFIYNISKENKIAFLRGYFCDGNFKAVTNDGNYGSIIFNTSSEKLYKDLCLLLSSIDVDYSVNMVEAKDVPFSKSEPRIIHRKKRYRIVINNLLEIFKIKEVVSDHIKSDIFFDAINAEHDKNDLRNRKKCFVKDVTPIGYANVVDININSPGHLFITSNGIITHNCALGGAGDPDTHEHFEEILKLSREYGIVPNFTTSGITMTEEKAKLCKEYCGAVAVSYHGEPYTQKAIEMLIDAGVKTNIHYVLGKNSIDHAIKTLKDGGFGENINAVVFLLYKPIGLGRIENILTVDNPKVKEFFNVIDNGNFNHKIGFDSCTCAGIVNYTKQINMDSIDYCEGGRYSMYIDAQMNAMPCSFGNQNPKYFVSLNDHTIEEAWNSSVFEEFRDSFRNSCKGCKNRSMCGGGCPICRDIVLCNRKEKCLL